MSIKDAQELKSLESRLAKLKAEKEQADKDYAAAAGKQSNLAAQIQTLRQQIETLKAAKQELIVTEHAIIRFMERAMGLDLGQIKEQILVASVKSANGKYPITNGLRAVVRDGSVVTVE